MAAILVQTGRRQLSPGVAGSSVGPYGNANLGDHVGDDPAAVTANRGLLAGALGLTDERLVFMNQVHGNAVAMVDESRTVSGSVDALVTAVPGLALAVLTADCVPILLYDEAAGVSGAVHAGRNGVRLDVIGAAVQTMRDLGAVSIAARIGPHICGSCYEVGPDVQADLAAVLPMTRSTTTWETAALDLGAGVREQLRLAGVEVVTADGRCTLEHDDLFSYRREPVTGRMAGLIAMTP